MRSYPVKENPIGAAVSEILRYRHTNRQKDILLLYYKDWVLEAVGIYLYRLAGLGTRPSISYFSYFEENPKSYYQIVNYPNIISLLKVPR